MQSGSRGEQRLSMRKHVQMQCKYLANLRVSNQILVAKSKYQLKDRVKMTGNQLQTKFSRGKNKVLMLEYMQIIKCQQILVSLRISDKSTILIGHGMHNDRKHEMKLQQSTAVRSYSLKIFQEAVRQVSKVQILCNT